MTLVCLGYCNLMVTGNIIWRNDCGDLVDLNAARTSPGRPGRAKDSTIVVAEPCNVENLAVKSRFLIEMVNAIEFDGHSTISNHQLCWSLR